MSQFLSTTVMRNKQMEACQASAISSSLRISAASNEIVLDQNHDSLCRCQECMIRTFGLVSIRQQTFKLIVEYAPSSIYHLNPTSFKKFYLQGKAWKRSFDCKQPLKRLILVRYISTILGSLYLFQTRAEGTPTTLPAY